MCVCADSTIMCLRSITSAGRASTEEFLGIFAMPRSQCLPLNDQRRHQDIVEIVLSFGKYLQLRKIHGIAFMTQSTCRCELRQLPSRRLALYNNNSIDVRSQEERGRERRTRPPCAVQAQVRIFLFPGQNQVQKPCGSRC